MTDRSTLPVSDPCGMDRDHNGESACQKEKECGAACGAQRKVPTWAVVLAVGAFVIFNVLFLSFAMSVSTPTLE